MRRYFYLLLALVAGLGGCSRCGRDDPRPDRNRALSIFLVESFMEVDPYMNPYLTAAQLVRHVDTIYTNRTCYPHFACNDTLWDVYEWHFGNGQVFKGKTLAPYTASGTEDVTDTVTLKVYSSDRRDSALAGMRFWILYNQRWPHTGRYVGRMHYFDHDTDNVAIDVVWRPKSSDAWRGQIQVRGIYNSACGCERDTICFYDVGVHQLYRVGLTDSEHAWAEQPMHFPKCRFPQPFGNVDIVGHYFNFSHDSVLFVSKRYHPTTNLPELVTFKGKRL